MVAFALTDQFLDDTKDHNRESGYQNSERTVDSDLGKEVEDARQDVEDVDQLLELQGEGDREECRPGVLRRLSLICRSFQL